MLFVTQPQYWPIALCIGIVLIIGKRCIDRYFLLPYQVPAHYVNAVKKMTRKGMRYMIVFAISITPLQIVLQTHRPELIIALDDSLSMQSSDTNPTRLNAALRLAHAIHDIGSFEHCYSLVSQAALSCHKYTTLQKSGTSITDLVLLASIDYPKQTILVLSDNGANNGIKTSQLNQQLSKATQQRLIWTDIQPTTKQLIVNGVQLSKTPSETNAIKAAHYFEVVSTDNDSIDILADQQKKILLQQAHSHSLPFNYALWLFVLIVGALISMQHFMEHLIIHRQYGHKKK